MRLCCSLGACGLERRFGNLSDESQAGEEGEGGVITGHGSYNSTYIYSMANKNLNSLIKSLKGPQVDPETNKSLCIYNLQIFWSLQLRKKALLVVH